MLGATSALAPDISRPSAGDDSSNSLQSISTSAAPLGTQETSSPHHRTPQSLPSLPLELLSATLRHLSPLDLLRIRFLDRTFDRLAVHALHRKIRSVQTTARGGRAPVEGELDRGGEDQGGASRSDADADSDTNFDDPPTPSLLLRLPVLSSASTAGTGNGTANDQLVTSVHLEYAGMVVEGGLRWRNMVAGPSEEASSMRPPQRPPADSPACTHPSPSSSPLSYLTHLTSLTSTLGTAVSELGWEYERDRDRDHGQERGRLQADELVREMAQMGMGGCEPGARPQTQSWENWDEGTSGTGTSPLPKHLLDRNRLAPSRGEEQGGDERGRDGREGTWFVFKPRGTATVGLWIPRVGGSLLSLRGPNVGYIPLTSPFPFSWFGVPPPNNDADAEDAGGVDVYCRCSLDGDTWGTGVPPSPPDHPADPLDDPNAVPPYPFVSSHGTNKDAGLSAVRLRTSKGVSGGRAGRWEVEMGGGGSGGGVGVKEKGTGSGKEGGGMGVLEYEVAVSDGDSPTDTHTETPLTSTTTPPSTHERWSSVRFVEVRVTAGAVFGRG
ncbi:hypothetical protein HDU93_004707 [Gonapodya sp. JEL0774]|nr:hypothetical protein HDU93_004707 [Gonapodya sp. JEL0774]